MTDPAEIVVKAHENYFDAVERLRQFPRFQAVMDDYATAPAVVLQCPKHHRLIEVKIGSPPDQNPPGWPRILHTNNADPGVASDGWDNLFEGTSRPITFGDDRLQLKCPRCTYSGTHTQEHLLAIYALALQTEKRTITLLA